MSTGPISTLRNDLSGLLQGLTSSIKEGTLNLEISLSRKIRLALAIFVFLLLGIFLSLLSFFLPSFSSPYLKPILILLLSLAGAVLSYYLLA